MFVDRHHQGTPEVTGHRQRAIQCGRTACALTEQFQAAFEVDAKDTTGAGDTFFGSFMAEYAGGTTVENALRYAAAASALQVTEEGAATAIPERNAVLDFIKERAS